MSKRKINQFLKKLDKLETNIDKTLEPLYQDLDDIIGVYEDRYMDRSEGWQESAKGQKLWDKIDVLRQLHSELDSILSMVSSCCVEIHYQMDQVTE